MLAERLPVEQDALEAELLEELQALELPQVTKTCPVCQGGQDGNPIPCHKCNGTGVIEVFSITTYDEAMSVAERLAAVVRAAQERAAAFDRRIARLQAEKEAALKPLRSRQQWLEALLTEYHQRVLEADKKAKTIPLCAGVTLKARKGSDGVDYGDEKALAKWLLQNAPTFVRPTVDKEPFKAALAFLPDGTAYLKDNGAVIPGVRFKPGEVEFKVKVELEEG